MFTLPVTTRSLILAKAISAMLVSLGTVLVITLLGVEIIGLSPVKLTDSVTYFGNWIIRINAVAKIGYGVIVAIAGLLSSIYHVYAAMAIGQLSNNNRFLFSFVAYGVLSIIITVIGIPTLSTLNTMANSLNDVFGFYGNWWVYLLENIVLIVVYHIITEVILTKKLNLE